jgi:uncharacterized membrane protein YjjB (DUF3815 family)
MIIQLISAFMAVLAFSVLLEVPKRHMAFAAATGAVGWCVYVLIRDAGHPSLAAAFVSTLVIALMSHILARLRKAPVTVFLVAGILPAVPGAAIYRCVYHLIRNNQALSVHYLVETLQIAGAIAMAIFIMDSFFRLFLVYHTRKEITRL